MGFRLNSEPSPPFDPARHGWMPVENVDGFFTTVGILWEQPVAAGRRFALLAGPQHCNRNGMVHGGLLTTLADQSMGITSWEANGGRRQATVQLNVHFMHGVSIGDFVVAECRVVRATRTLLFVSADFRVGAVPVVAAQGVWKLLGRPR